MIQGGWGYVWCAYGLTWFVVVGYAVSLWRRTQRVAAEEKRLAS